MGTKRSAGLPRLPRVRRARFTSGAAASWRAPSSKASKQAALELNEVSFARCSSPQAHTGTPFDYSERFCGFTIAQVEGLSRRQAQRVFGSRNSCGAAPAHRFAALLDRGSAVADGEVEAWRGKSAVRIWLSHLWLRGAARKACGRNSGAQVLRRARVARPRQAGSQRASHRSSK
jgi:hypothetical protein